MRIIKENFLRTAAGANTKAGKWLELWRIAARTADWENIEQVRKTYPSADPVKVRSGRTVTIFNACGNDYRLIVAIHYNKRRIYLLRFLTHADYDKNRWKTDL